MRGKGYARFARFRSLGKGYSIEELCEVIAGNAVHKSKFAEKTRTSARSAQVYQNEDCDDRFAFIAGYTDGGAPFGVMWEEVGVDPGLPFEEKVKLYHMQMLG